ncbi:MAG: class I SAM-dependent methyltransferase, partial [Polyangia bacterium]
MADKDQAGGDIDFSDGELSEMGVELAGRAEAPPAPRRSRSMLRVPVDEVPRPRGATDPTASASTTEPSLPAIPALPVDPADEVVEHAFRNGGVAEGVVPAELRLAATPARDELEAFTAKLIADRERVIEMEVDDDSAPEPDTDPKALTGLAKSGPVPQPVDDGPTREQRSSGAQRVVNPALAALARAVAVPPPAESSEWLAPSQTTVDETDPGAIVSSVSAPSPSSAPIEHDELLNEEDDADAEMELDDGELEDVEPMAQPERQRSLTPVVAPPPMPENAPAKANGNGHGNGHGAAQTSATPLAAGASGHTGPIATPPPSPPAAAHSSAHAVSPGATPSLPNLPAAPPPAPSPPSAGPPSAAPPLPPPAAAPPPPPPAAPAQAPAPPAPPAPPVIDKAVAVAAQTAEAPLRPRRKRRAKQWFEEIFDDDYLRTLPFLTPRQTEREAQFIGESLGIPAGGALLDLACGYGRHAMELAAKSYKVTGLDLSLPLLIRAADAARRVGVNVNFIHGDMREMTFENEFDGAYCMFTSFGFFDDDTNRKVAANLARA